MRFGTRRSLGGAREVPGIVPTRPMTRSTKMKAWRGSVSFLNLTILWVHAPTHSVKLRAPFALLGLHERDDEKNQGGCAY